MNPSIKLALAAALAAAALAPLSPASAQVSWTNWTAETNGDTNGSATGALTLPGQSPIGVTYSGEINFAQISGQGGTNPWNPASTFTSIPPDNEFLASVGGPGKGVNGVNTLTFSAPVLNPVMDIFSLGSTDISNTPNPGIVADYDFSAPFTILSQGPTTLFGSGTLTQPTPTTLEGAEGSGTIQFSGLFNSISWSDPTAEYYTGFQVGAPAPVPEASTTVSFGLLLALGMGGLVVAAKKRKTA